MQLPKEGDEWPSPYSGLVYRWSAVRSCWVSTGKVVDMPDELSDLARRILDEWAEEVLALCKDECESNGNKEERI